MIGQATANLINEDFIFTSQEFDTKKEIIEFLAKNMYKLGRLHDYDAFVESVYEREECFPTCIGHGIAIPHGKSDSVAIPSFSFMNLKNKIKWDDEEEVNLVFLIAVPCSSSENIHLKVLAELSKKLMNEEFRNTITQMIDTNEICKMLTFDIK